MLVNLNTIVDVPANFASNTDWLEIVKVENNVLRFGVWEIRFNTLQDSSQLIKKIGVSRTGLFDILQNAGFAKRYRDDGTYVFIQVTDNILSIVSPAQIKDFIINLVGTLPNELTIQGFKLTREQLNEVFLLQHHILFGENTLSPLKNNDSVMLTDTPREMFFPYLNTIVKVSSSGVELLPYAELKNLCIWESHIKKRNFEISDSKAMFSDFLTNVCCNDLERLRAMRAAIGYAMHRYYSSSNTKAIVLYDEAVTNNQTANGRTGKSLWAVGVGHMREMETLNGKKFCATDKFNLQRITDNTEAAFFDDVLPDFNFEFFNSILTNGWEVEAKNKLTLRIPLERSPKMIIASNTIMKTLDGNTSAARQYILEFGDYYSKLLDKYPLPVHEVHGCEFFRDWDSKEWNSFDNFMITSCIDYLANGLPLQKTKNVEYNRLLQNTSEDFINWVTEKDFQTFTDYHFPQHYIEFKSLFYGENSQWASSTFGKWLKLYAKTGGHTYGTHRFNTVVYFTFKKNQ